MNLQMIKEATSALQTVTHAPDPVAKKGMGRKGKIGLGLAGAAAALTAAEAYRRHRKKKMSKLSSVMPSFMDEMRKIAGLPSPARMKSLLTEIGASGGKLGKKAVPKHKSMTAYFRGGKVIKQPTNMPPPLPQH